MRRAPLLLLLLATCGRPSLAFLPRPIAIGYDAEDVLDVAPLDLDHDGDTDFVAALASGPRYMTCDRGAWRDETLGTALDAVGPLAALRPDGGDLLIQRPDGTRARLVWSGIGSWHVGGAAPAALPDAPRTAEADLDGDGRPDRVELDGRRVRVLLRDEHGALHDATAALGVDALPLRGDAHAVYVADLDVDGDLDLLVVGGRVMAYINNGGRPPAH